MDRSYNIDRKFDGKSSSKPFRKFDNYYKEIKPARVAGNV